MLTKGRVSLYGDIYHQEICPGEPRHHVGGPARLHARRAFFQQNKEESITITARNLRTTNRELLERQWQYVKDHVYEKVPLPSENGFKLIFDVMAPSKSFSAPTIPSVLVRKANSMSNTPSAWCRTPA